MKALPAIALSTLLLASCSSNHLSSVDMVPTAHAQSSGSFTCTPPALFQGVDDGAGGAMAFFTTCTANNVPSSGGNYVADVSYVLQHDLQVSEITTWLGTAQSSILETGGELSLEIPSGSSFKTVAIVTNQKDKHADVEGERIEHLSNGTYNLPAGTKLHVRGSIGIIKPETNCPLGCAMQLNVYLNPPAR